MKASSAGVFASFLAASTVALSSCSAGDCNVAVIPSCGQGSRRSNDSEEEERRSSIEEKFAPRFDGLRFIETLVTAHR